MASLTSLGVFVLINFAAASSGAVFKPGRWYEDLRKPPWTPPNWAFPVVWSLLFAANATAGWLVWRAAGAAAWPALVLYGVSLIVNAAWSALFFGRQRMRWALIDAAALWLSIVAVMIAFAPYSLLAAALMAPYAAWVTVAFALNLRLIQLNPGVARAAG